MGNFLHERNQPTEQENEIEDKNVTRFNVENVKKNHLL